MAPVKEGHHAPRRPCAADQLGELAPSHGYLKVPFARCADGVARHVTAVSPQLGGPFTCLDCEELLTLRRPYDKRAHFAHRPDSSCAGESALHHYAKELLRQTKTLTLPALVLRNGGLNKTVFERGAYKFDTVMPEKKVGLFQPDAIVTYKGVELAVEFLVSHAVDVEKRNKVLERDLSMVEVDLSGVQAGHLSAEALDQAILHSAPRQWIHHRRRAAAEKKLADDVAAKRAERGRRLAGHIKKPVRPIYPQGWTDEASRSVEAAGLSHLIDLDVGCGHWFAVPRAVWQAHALEVHIIAPSRLFTPGDHSVAIKGEWPKERALSSKLPVWMIRSDLNHYQPELLAEAGYDSKTFGSADRAVWNYFAALLLRREAVVYNGTGFFIEPKLHGRLFRRAELHRLVTKLLRAVDHNDPERGYRHWESTFRVGRATVAGLVEMGDDSYLDLRHRLNALETMLPSYSRKVIDDLCSLPLGPIRERNLAAIATDEKARLRKAEEAANGRQDSIRRRAEQMLEQDAPDWLARVVEPGGANVVEFASTSDEALHKAQRLLEVEAELRRQAILAEQRTAALREKLTQAARQAFPNPAMAELFLNSAHPQIGRCRPIDYCDSEGALQILQRLLPKRR